MWHSINFFLLKDTRLCLYFLSFKCSEMSWILSRKNGLMVYWQWSLQMASLFSPVFFFPPQMEKNKSIMWTAGSRLLSLLCCRWPFCKNALPLYYRYSKQFIKWNAKPDICSFLAGYLLKSGTCHLLFTWPFGLPKAPPLLCTAIHTMSKCQSVLLFFDSIMVQARGFDI